MKIQSSGKQRETLQRALAAFVGSRPGEGQGARIAAASASIGCSPSTVSYYLAEPKKGKTGKPDETWPQFVVRKPGMMTPRNLQDFASQADVSLDFLATGEGEAKPIAATIADVIRATLIRDADAEVANASTALARTAAKTRRAFVTGDALAIDGEAAIAIILRTVRAELLKLQHHQHAAAVAVNAQLLQGEVRSVAAKVLTERIGRHSKTILTSSRAETEILRFSKGYAKL